MPRAVTSKHCFACGTRNRRGLRIRLIPDGRGVHARFVPPPHVRGFSLVAHGGIHAVLLDEAIGVAVGLATDSKSVTVSLAIDYRRPMLIGKPVIVRAWLERRGRRYAYGAGEIRDAAGRLVAQGRARIVPLAPRLAGRFIGKGRAEF